MENFNLLENALTAKSRTDEFCIISLSGELVPGFCEYTKTIKTRLTKAKCFVYRKECFNQIGEQIEKTGITSVRNYNVYYDENMEFYIEVTRLYADGEFRIYLKNFK
jgi:hypothetical protein